MRKLVLDMSLLLSTATLVALCVVCARSYTQPTLLSAEITGSTSSLVISCRGHVHWRKERLLDENWVPISIELNANVLEVLLDYRPAQGSFDGLSISLRGGMSQTSLVGRHLPQWTHITVPAPTFPTYLPGPAMSGTDFREIVLPYWCFILLAFAATLLSANQLRKSYRRQRLARSGHCSACGYDLRATPTLCPECGAPARPHELRA